MGKQYKADLTDMRIEDGKLMGVNIIDNFSSANEVTKEVRKIDNATFVLDNLLVEDMIAYLWADLKVKMQARSWKKMNDRDFLALDGEVHDVLEHLPKSERAGGGAKALNTYKLEQQKKFYDKALVKAIDELGTDADATAINTWAINYYDKEYKELVEG